MYCTNCGKEIDNNAETCVHCGQALKQKTVQPQPKPQTQQPKPQTQARPQAKPQPKPQQQNDAGTYAILGFVFAFILPLIGIIVSAVSLGKYKSQEIQQNKGLAIAGLILSILSTVGIAIYVIVYVVFFVVMMTAGSTMVIL